MKLPWDALEPELTADVNRIVAEMCWCLKPDQAEHDAVCGAVRAYAAKAARETIIATVEAAAQRLEARGKERA